MVYDNHSDNFTLPEFRTKVMNGMRRDGMGVKWNGA